MLKHREYVIPAACFFVFLGLCSFLFYHNLFLLLLFVPGCWKGKSLLERYHEEKEKSLLLKEFKDFLFCLSADFATGRHMCEGIKHAETYLTEIYGQNSILVSKLDYMLKAMVETGETDVEVLDRFAKETGLEDILMFVDVYKACVETGGDMVSAVDKAASVIGEKIKLENEIKTLLSQKKFEGRMIATMPFTMLFFLQMIAPSYLQVMYETVAGRLMMTAALVLNVITMYWIERMTDVKC